MSEIGASIQEVMESYEVKIKGETYPIKAIRTITGHDIKQYCIHGDKQVPFIKNTSRQKMEEGEIFAIETFGTTGKGYLKDDVRYSLFINCPGDFTNWKIDWNIWIWEKPRRFCCSYSSPASEGPSQDH